MQWFLQCHGSTCVPPKDVNILPVPYLDITLLGNRVFEGHQVKMSSLEWALNQYDHGFIKKGNLDPARHTYQKNTMWTRRQRLGWCSCKLRNTNDRQQIIEARRKAWNRCPRSVLRRNQPCRRLDLGFQSSEVLNNTFLFFKPLVCDILFWQP